MGFLYVRADSFIHAMAMVCMGSLFHSFVTCILLFQKSEREKPHCGRTSQLSFVGMAAWSCRREAVRPYRRYDVRERKFAHALCPRTEACYIEIPK